MNKTLLLITFTTLFASVHASSFTDGFIMGVIVDNLGSDNTPPQKYIDNRRYIHQIIDTELIPFTPKHQYKCYDIYTEKECYDKEESGGWYYTFYENYETCGEFCNSNDRLTPNNCN